MLDVGHGMAGGRMDGGQTEQVGALHTTFPPSLDMAPFLFFGAMTSYYDYDTSYMT